VTDVNVELEFKGESRVKIVKTTTTDKRGGWVRAGLPAGKYRVTFQKKGFKQYILETDVSLGSLSELPDVKLPKAVAPTQSADRAEGGVIPAEAEAALAAQARDAYGKAVEATAGCSTSRPLWNLATFPDVPGAYNRASSIRPQGLEGGGGRF
jgi:hypothetical protein